MTAPPPPVDRPTTFASITKPTDEALADPKVGDIYQEMYSFWSFVVDIDVEQDWVTFLDAASPCTIPDDAKINGCPLSTFAADAPMRFSLIDERGANVDGWLDACLATYPRAARGVSE